MKRYHQEIERTRRAHRLHLRELHDWPYKPVPCPCDLQPGRFRKVRPLGCPKRNCRCKSWKREPSTRDRRLKAVERAALRELLYPATDAPDGSED